MPTSKNVVSFIKFSCLMQVTQEKQGKTETKCIYFNDEC